MRGVEIERQQIASAVIRDLDKFTETMGVDYETLASAVGLGDFTPDDETDFVNLDRFAKFLEVASILSGDDSFGLRFASWQKEILTGPLSLAMLNAPTVRDSLAVMVKFIATRINVAEIEFVIESDVAYVEWAFSPLIIRRWQLVDFTASAHVNRMMRIYDEHWRPHSVQLVRPPPRNREAHRQLFGRSVEYSCARNMIVLPASHMSRPIKNADPVIYNISVRLLARMAQEHAITTDLVTSVREEIVHALPTEDGAQLDRISRRMGMSVRTLQRSLATHGTSFQGLVDETRKKLASSYLEDPDLTFSQISYQLGFSAPSAFTRASYRWFGQRPGAVRRSLRHGLSSL